MRKIIETRDTYLASHWQGNDNIPNPFPTSPSSGLRHVFIHAWRCREGVRYVVITLPMWCQVGVPCFNYFSHCPSLHSPSFLWNAFPLVSLIFWKSQKLLWFRIVELWRFSHLSELSMVLYSVQAPGHYMLLAIVYNEFLILLLLRSANKPVASYNIKANLT